MDSLKLVRNGFSAFMPRTSLVNVKNVLAAASSVTSKKLPNVYKSCPKMIPLEKLKILTPKALKSCPKSNKSPNLVTLVASKVGR